MKKKSNVPNADKIADQLGNFAIRGQYKKGAELAKKVLKQYPTDFYFTYQYAKLLGDWADDLPAKRRKKLKSEAAEILKPLTKRLSGQTPRFRFGVCLNYYYQTYSFRAMYNFGKRFIIQDRKLGFYGQALGAGLLAEQQYHAGAQGTCVKWAKKSIQLWQKYGLKGETYYFPFYSLATSHIILDQPQEAMKNLKKAAQVSHREVQCPEFKILYRLIQKKMK